MGSEGWALARALSLLLAIIGGFLALTLVLGLLLGEGAGVWQAFGPSVLLGLGFLVLTLILPRPAPKQVLSARAGYLFVSLGWVMSAALGALPYWLSGALPGFTEAFFETMSGLSTTGASVLPDIEALPRSLLFWRALTHWLGGMGIVVLTVAVFPLLGLGGRALMEAEAPGPQVDKITPKLSETAKILWLIYLGLTLLLTGLLWLGGLDWFEALTHSFATLATGGFSTRNASVGAFGSGYIDAVLTVFMFLAGMNFTLHWRLLRGQVRVLGADSEFKTYLAITLGAVGLVTLNLWSQGPWAGDWLASLRFGSFQAVSILTTTGFATADYLAWPAFSQGLLFALMFIGGCAGSTGGGMKVGRLMTLFKMGRSELRYLLNPRGFYGVVVDGRYFKKNVVYDIAAMVFLYLLFLGISTLVLAAFGYDLLTSLSASLASLGNIGPGFGLVGPALNFSHFSPLLQAWLSFMMLLGRLEIYTVLILFTRSFWRSP